MRNTALIILLDCCVLPVRPNASLPWQEKLIDRTLKESRLQHVNLVHTVLLKAPHSWRCRGCSNDKELTQSPSPSKVPQFTNFASWPGCLECGKIFGPFLQGIKDAGYLKSASWEENMLLVEFTSDTLYGQIASNSRVPLMWRLSNPLKFTVDQVDAKTAVNAEGIGLWGSEQALDIYKDVLNAANLDGSACVGSLSNWTCIQTEIAAAGKYLHTNWKSIRQDTRKVTRVMMTMFNMATYSAIGAAGKWPTIFYSIITAVPRIITSFLFERGLVSASVTPDTTHPEYADYERLHLFDKSSIMGAKSLLDCPMKLFGIAMSKAASGMNLAMMLSAGDPRTRGPMIDRGINAGLPVKIGNLMAWCAGSPPGSDPKCRGIIPGRVAWGPDLPEAMIAAA